MKIERNDKKSIGANPLQPKASEGGKFGLSNVADVILWGIVAILMVVSVWANYHYGNVDLSLRLIGWFVVSIIAIVIASRTKQGKFAWQFAKEARNELRRVVWPTRQETLQSTLVVFVLIVVIALIIWGIDTLFFHTIGWLAG